MRENGLDAAQVPLVIQFNKRDLPDTQDRRRDRRDARRKGKEPVIGAVAIRGEGVLETLHAVLQAGLPRAWTARANLSQEHRAHRGGVPRSRSSPTWTPPAPQLETGYLGGAAAVSEAGDSDRPVSASTPRLDQRPRLGARSGG